MNNMTAVEWIFEISKQREPDKFDWEKAKEMEKWQRMKFEIPELSDDEIIKELFGKWYDPNNDAHYNLIEGAKWYREQIKK